MAKFYAVKEGRKPGIYTNWPETQKQTSGFKGAVFQSFPSRVEAEDYLGITQNPFERHGATPDPSVTSNINGQSIPEIIANLDEDIVHDAAIVYTDGSYNKSEGIYGYGYSITYDSIKTTAFGGGNSTHLVDMWQVGGELLAAMYGLQEALSLGASKIIIRYDYKGVEQWATGTWATNKPGTQWYRNTMRKLISQFDGTVVFEKVKAHSNEAGNEEADQLAKRGAGLL